MGLVQKNLVVAEAKGVATTAVKICLALDRFIVGLSGGKRTFARGNMLSREGHLYAWSFCGEMQRVWSTTVGVFLGSVTGAAVKTVWHRMFERRS